jgi:hypothetical protein
MGLARLWCASRSEPQREFAAHDKATKVHDADADGAYGMSSLNSLSCLLEVTILTRGYVCGGGEFSDTGVVRHAPSLRLVDQR